MSRPYQLSILGNQARNKVLVLHRRAGKTSLAVNQLIIEACKPENAGRTFWYIAPTYSQGKEIVWNDPKMLFYYLPQELIKKRNESELWVKLFNDARIVIKGGEEPDALLGSDPYGIVVDETQNQKEELYSRVLRPILAANNGWIWFLGTPRVKDHFFHKFVYASQNPRWQAFRLGVYESKIIAEAELEEIKQNTPMDLFRQEYLAEFLDGEGAVFRNVRELCQGPMKGPEDGHIYSIGVDLARKLDFTVVTVYDQSTNEVVFIDRFQHVDWAFQKIKIEAIARKYNTNGSPSKIKMDSTGVGDPIYQDLRTAGLIVQPIQFTNTLKEQIIRNLQVKFDLRNIRCPEYIPLINELEVFEEKISESNRSKFSAPENLNDDTVFSLALAVYNAPFLPGRPVKDKRSLLMKKYRNDKKFFMKPRNGLYNLGDLS